MSRLNTKAWSQAGVSIVQALIMTAVLASLAVTGTMIITDQKKSIKTIDSKNSVEEVHRMIYSILQNEAHCLNTLYQNGFTGTLYPDSNMVLDTIRVAVSNDIVFESSPTVRYDENKVRIDSMVLRFPADFSEAGELSIRYGIKKTPGPDSPETIIPKKIAITFKRNSPTSLTGCSSVVLDSATPAGGNETVLKEACEDFKIMTWDDNLKTCNLKDTICPPDKIFAGVDETGEEICKSVQDYLPYLISTDTNTCPDDFNMIKLARSPNWPYKIMVECIKKAATCPSAVEQIWSKGSISCEGWLPRSSHGEVASAIDGGAPTIGEAPYRCNNGSWVALSGSTCRAPCAEFNASWGSCTSDSPLSPAEHGEIQSATDATPISIGTRKFRCNMGVWKPHDAGTCSTPCAASTKDWSQNGATCSVNLPASTDGEVKNVADSVAPNTGFARFTCSSGTWKISSFSCVNYTPGTCRWTTEVNWQYPDCSGFQNQNALSVPGEQAVTSKYQCTQICSVCTSGASKLGCTFIPD